MLGSSFGVIYLITNTANGKIYVGQTIKGMSIRFSEHKSAARRPGRVRAYLHKAMAKYGVDVFRVETLAFASSIDELNRLEIDWIAKLRSTERGIGYNGTYGGDNALRTPETRARISASKIGKRLSDAHRALLSKIGRGRKQTREHVLARTAALHGRTPSPQCRAAVAEANRHRVISDDTRAKLRAHALKINEARWGLKPKQAA